MVSGGLFTQIGMIIISVAIIFTYIKPEFTKIGEVQDAISTYKSQRTTVLSVNSQLSLYVAKIEDRSADDQNRLANYIPESIDSVLVLRDLYLITKEAGVIYIDSEYSESDLNARRSNDEALDNSSEVPLIHPLSLSVEGTYSQIKVMLDLLEHNHYPLQISKLSISTTEADYLKADMELNTYSYRPFDVEDSNL